MRRTTPHVFLCFVYKKSKKLLQPRKNTTNETALNTLKSEYAEKIGEFEKNIGENKTAIGSLTATITLGTNISRIGENVFMDSALTDVYYKGSESDWSEIAIHAWNAELEQAQTHFNS